MKRIIHIRAAEQDKEEEVNPLRSSRREMDVEAGIMEKLVTAFIEENDEAKLEEAIDFIFSVFIVIEDSQDQAITSPMPIYNMLQKYLEQDFEKRFPKLLNRIVGQYQGHEIYSGKYNGYEWIGSGGATWGGQYSIPDLMIVSSVIEPCLWEYYQSDKEKVWSYIKKDILHAKIDENHPAFLKRATIPVLLERTKEEESRKEAFRYLSRLVKIRKGIPRAHERLLAYISDRFDELDQDLILRLVMTDIKEYGLPSNVFTVILLFRLIEAGVEKAKSILVKLLKDENYFKRDYFHYDTFVHAVKIVKKALTSPRK